MYFNGRMEHEIITHYTSLWIFDFTKKMFVVYEYEQGCLFYTVFVYDKQNIHAK